MSLSRLRIRAEIPRIFRQTFRFLYFAIRINYNRHVPVQSANPVHIRNAIPCISPITHCNDKPIIRNSYSKEEGSNVPNTAAIPNMYIPIVLPSLQIPHSLVNDKMEMQETSLHRDEPPPSPSMQYYNSVSVLYQSVEEGHTFRHHQVGLLREYLGPIHTYMPSTRDT